MPSDVAGDKTDIGSQEERSEVAYIRSASGEYKFRLEQASNERDEKLRRNLLRMALVFLWTLGSILLVTIMIFAWHKLAPSENPDLHFLTEDQIDSIQTFLLSSALTAFLSSLGRGLLDKYKFKQK